jgi:hypothetical protein
MSTTRLVVLASACLGFLISLSLALRPGLRLEEVSSLSLATGHSLEQRPDLSDPAWQDFELPERPKPSSFFKSYTQNKPSFHGLPKDVIRAVLLSSAQPPAYPLLLHAWLSLWGSGDFALRAFSLLCWLACVPLLWRLSSRLGGRLTAPISCLVFSLNPLSWYYASLGLPITLLWLESLLLVELSLIRKPKLAWILVASLGLYTHVAFFLVWLACSVVIFRQLNHRSLRPLVLPLAFFLPWIVMLPGIWSAWRATPSGWTGMPSLSASPLGQAAQAVAKNFKEGDLVLVAGLPAAILGVVRALPADLPVAGWVPEYRSLDLRWNLGSRLEGRRRVFLVMASPQDGRRDIQIRLRTSAFLLQKFQFGEVNVDLFGPMAGIKFGALSP